MVAGLASPIFLDRLFVGFQMEGRIDRPPGEDISYLIQSSSESRPDHALPIKSVKRGDV
jgi:hypothetical protein